MFSLPQYQGAVPPPPVPAFHNAALTVCQVLNLSPYDIVPTPDGNFLPRHEVIAHDCAMVLLLMQSLASEGHWVRHG